MEFDRLQCAMYIRNAVVCGGQHDQFHLHDWISAERDDFMASTSSVIYAGFYDRADTTDSGLSPSLAYPAFVLVPCGRLSCFLRAFDCTLIPLLLTYLFTDAKL